MFKNQEIREFSKDLKASEEKVDQLENVLIKVHDNAAQQVS